MRVLIVGAGAIGVSIAYHLAARGADVIVIERSAIACAASGKSGSCSSKSRPHVRKTWCGRCSSGQVSTARRRND
jgi:glycine/D-amino acid oxidase-like deaminating enzyme